MKLIYSNGTVIETLKIPANFTGIREELYGKLYYENGQWHRDGGLAAIEGADGSNCYFVNGKCTGRWFPPYD
jgi:hypothetical protein